MLSPDASPLPRRSRSLDSNDRRPIEQALATEGVHRDIDLSDFEDRIGSSPTTDQKKSQQRQPTTDQPLNLNRHPHHDATDQTIPQPTRTSTSSSTHGKGHAHDPLSDRLFLAVGPGGNVGPDNQNTDNGNDVTDLPPPPDPPIVSESPPAADINIYETAYHKEVERIRQMQGEEATTYLTRRVEGSDTGNTPGEEEEGNGKKPGGVGGGSRLANALQLVREKEGGKEECKEEG